jgi:hypothetical protein
LGDRIELRDWKGFRGGLDVNRTRAPVCKLEPHQHRCPNGVMCVRLCPLSLSLSTQEIQRGSTVYIPRS